MTINRVPAVPFAQIANSALRDTRLSFKARGVLALALSNVGEWNAGRDYFEQMSDHDGRTSIQTALNELTDLGYRTVTRVQDDKGRWSHVVDWNHIPTVRPPGNPSVGAVGGNRTPSKKTRENSAPSSSSSSLRSSSSSSVALEKALNWPIYK